MSQNISMFIESSTLQCEMNNTLVGMPQISGENYETQ